jgi:hypothetical protein
MALTEISAPLEKPAMGKGKKRQRSTPETPVNPDKKEAREHCAKGNATVRSTTVQYLVRY